MDWIAALIQIVVSTLIVAAFLWISGRALVGKDKAKFLDAIWIVLLGTIIEAAVRWAAVTWAFPDLIGLIIVFIVWLGLIKHFFDCGWIMAFAIALIAVIIAAVVLFILAIVLALIGIAIVASWI